MQNETPPRKNLARVALEPVLDLIATDGEARRALSRRVGGMMTVTAHGRYGVSAGDALDLPRLMAWRADGYSAGRAPSVERARTLAGALHAVTLDDGRGDILGDLRDEIRRAASTW